MRPEAEVLSWLGTPYHHQQAVKGIGCDCLGLLRGVYASVFEKPLVPVPPYGPAWDEVAKDETLLAAAHEYLIPHDKIEAGTVLVFRMKRTAVAKHCGIAISSDTMVHAHMKQGVVKERLTEAWMRRVAGTFKFPEVTNG